VKITFIGAGSTVFAKNLAGDCMLTPALQDSEIALYDINEERLIDSFALINATNKNCNGQRARIKKYLGVKERKVALKDTDFVVNSMQSGGYDPCTIFDFEIPKKYGLRQTIADTVGIGGIMRSLRTIAVLKEIAVDIEEVCPNAWLLNYTNPMSMISGYMQRYTNVKTVGLCHSVQGCAPHLLSSLGIEVDGYVDKIAGINHMGWLLEIKDLKGNDLYPLIREKALEKNKNEKHGDMVRFDYIKNLGFYCTESSEHNAEYNMFYIKSKYPELIEKFNIPLDEYPRRCIEQIKSWEIQRADLFTGGDVTHTRTGEYASYIMEAIVTNKPYKIGGNILNNGFIQNLPKEACVEVPCLVDETGINGTFVGKLPVQLAAMNMTNINTQLITIDIVSMCDELIEAHEKAGFSLGLIDHHLK
jgi:alpha-galactosidase